MQKMNDLEFKSFADFSQDSLASSGIDCNEDRCKIFYKNKKLFFILKRMEVAEICGKKFDVIVNLSRKYTIPQCESKSDIIIDNQDLLKKGGHFLYFKEDKIVVKAAR